MSEHIYTYRNDTFNINQAYDYTLLLQIDVALFSYAIIHDKQLLAWDANCSLNELTHPHELHEQLNANYKKIIIGLPATGFTLIPASLYNSDKIAAFARILDVQANEKVLAQQLDEQNYIIYKADGIIADAAQKFSKSSIVPVSKGWIKAIAQNNPANDNLYLNLDNNKADFLSFKDGKLRFYNSFGIKNVDDLAYYTAFVTEELGIEPQNIHLILSGGIRPEGKSSSKLAEFFPSIVFNDVQILELPEQITSHQLLPLAALSLCGSSEVR